MTEAILVAIDPDDTELNTRMLDVASDFARLKDARLTLLSVAPDPPPAAAIQLPDDYRARTSSRISERLDQLVGQLDLPARTATVAVRFGSIYREILAQAKEDNSDLIVIGCHRPDLADYLLGPNAARVVRHASCSVFVVR